MRVLGLRSALCGIHSYCRGSWQLRPELEEKHLVLLRDGRTLIGFLRSIDQFANLVLHQTVERIHVGKKYGDIPRGIFVVRGENVVLLGEILQQCFRYRAPCVAQDLRHAAAKNEASSPKLL
ncbi:PREDICTED: U6 snRNA-associated Sm-like protein LSm1 isoform X3 [Chinchilla lanigera]|uniref:U6 snRNA-associated Sm-like protein LSm1 isoform X3 n=1 Tax=Chinchilla lanigera TaxID=34839 RepID=UPI00038ED617|nr:PREDICTED: U6 snRNA-associated Sm-like protein LSm1 isoform X3 [Chinchilla lanigera]